MKEKYANRLIHEKSPYLLQHAHNPVNWYPWGEEIFSLAQKEDKPILLSIGYASCHWCHVMEEESFADPHTARILNENFLAIKLDREEAPDIDHIYMRSLQAMGQQGGWPLNIFLTPEKLPITGGTYFPPQPLYGRPSFIQVLEAVSKAWKTERQKLLESARAIYDFLKEEPPSLRKEGEGELLDSHFSLLSGSIEKTLTDLKGAYEPQYGGFLGNGPNKFPPFLQILFLTTCYRKNKDKEVLEMIENTLEGMKRGGIYDQLGGGLSRYSTDHKWLVPHFEKMLYDNALFVWALAETFRITQKEKYREWILDICTYIKRDMTSPEGAFYSSEDADSEGQEGKFYTWSLAEFQRVLKEKAKLSIEECEELSRFWGLTKEGNFENYNILHEPMKRKEFLRGLKYSEEEWEKILSRAREALLEERKRRIRPSRDDKILISWNAYMISALAQAARALGAAELAEQAQNCANFLWAKLWSPKGELLRRFREGEARFSGGLVDYAALGCAFLDLYRANFDPENMERAKLLGEKIVEKFSDPNPQGAFYDSPKEKKDLILRMRDPYDGVEPSGNALAARLFFSLSRYGIQSVENQKNLKKILRYFSRSMENNGSIHCFLLRVCCSFLEEGPWEISILDDSENKEYLEEAKKVLEWINREFSGETILALGNRSNLDKAAKEIDLLAHKPPLLIEENKSAIYLCANLSCQKPVYSLASLKPQFQSNVP